MIHKRGSSISPLFPLPRTCLQLLGRVMAAGNFSLFRTLINKLIRVEIGFNVINSLPFIKSQSYKIFRCPGVSGGAISSPSFPLNYPDKSRVEYHLETYRDSRIRLQFEVFDLEETSNCRADYLQIDYSRTFCGKDLPGPFTSGGNTMYIRFESDYLENGQGFLATWTEVPPPSLIRGRTQGEFKTPNYPKKYPKHTRIIQTFAIPEGAKVEFKVVDFQTGEKNDHLCINSPDWRTNRPGPDRQVKPEGE